MYIKFKVTDGGYSDGGFGLQGAIDWAMTSAAGNTATASDFVGSFNNEISDLIVVSNDEAGGWTNYDAVSASSSNYTWGAGWEAPSPKTGRAFKKRFEVSSQTTTISSYGNWCPKYGAYDSDKDSYIQGLTRLQYYNGVTSTVYHNTFFGNGTPDDQTDGYWNLSVTSKYVYLWPDSSVNTTTGRRWLAGAADLAGTPQYLLNPISDNVASVGFYTSGSDAGGASGTSTTTAYWNDYLIYYFAGVDAGSPFNTTSATNGILTQYSATPSLNYSLIPLNVHPTHYYNIVSNFYEQQPPAFDEWGSPRGSLTPVTVMSPMRGVPVQYLEGIYYYSPQAETDVTRGLEWSNQAAHRYNNRIIYDDNGDKYVLWHQYGSMHIKAIRAM